MKHTVTSLSKVTLSITAGPGRENLLPADVHLFSFVFGAASGGLTPFELKLSGLGGGDTVVMEIAQNQLASNLGHLFSPMLHSLKMPILPKKLLLQVTINRIEECEPREIIKAMAAAVGGGCGGGDCDCGCG